MYVVSLLYSICVVCKQNKLNCIKKIKARLIAIVGV